MRTIQDLNSVTLICRLVRDPELRTTGSGTSVCTLRVAYTQSRKGASGQYEDAAGFIDVSVFGKQADTVVKFLTKGRQIAVKGRLDFREWGEGDGRRSATQIIAEQVQFIGSGESSGQQQSVSQQANPANAPKGDDESIPF